MKLSGKHMKVPFFRQVWLLGVKSMEIDSNLFSRYMNFAKKMAT